MEKPRQKSGERNEIVGFAHERERARGNDRLTGERASERANE